MSGFPWAKVAATLFGSVGLGYIIMKAVTPTPEQLYAKMSPEVRRQVDSARTQRLAAENAVNQQVTVQKAADTDPDSQKPIWAEQRK